MLILWPIHQLEREHSQYPGIMMISAVLKARGFRSEVVSAEIDSVTARLETEGDAIIGFSSTTAFVMRYLELARAVKLRFPRMLTVFGGAHPTYFPEMIEDEGVDVVCVGEGEYAMAELVEARRRGADFTSIRNLWVKQNGTIHKNPLRPLLRDLDELPTPDHRLFLDAARTPLMHAIVMTGRGCPYSCTYCYNNAYKKLYSGLGPVVRRRSVGHVMEELRLLKAGGCRMIRFMDDIFTVSADWVHEFAERYRSEIGLPFTCLARANLMTPAIARDLKNAGCHRVLIGVEAGNDRLRHEVFKRKMSKEQILDAAKMIRAAGIKLVTASILAIPGGSLAADWETVELNIKAQASFASASLLQAMPGTEIHEYAQHLGLLHEDNIQRISTGGFGFSTALRHEDRRDAKQMENLHKFFTLVTWFPWLKPLVRLLIKLPPNRLYVAIYMATFNIGSHLIAMPARIGFPILVKRFVRKLMPRRRRKAVAEVVE